jgi:DNA-binding SARP family transcriptional activator
VLELRILGGLRLTEDGSIRRFRAPDKAVGLLAYLVLRPGPVDRTSLAELLWPDDPTDEARTKLRRHLYDLTQVLPPNVAWIVGDKRTVAWNREAPCRLDAARFTELAQSDPAAALAFYGGDLLPTIESPWLAGERERLRAQAVRLREELANEALARGAYAEALEHATHLSAADPWNESAVRTHIGARIAVGDATGAAAVYHAFARRLKDDLGVEPAAVTRAAYEAAVAPPRTTRIVGTRLTSFIGRTTDIRAIAALLEHASLVTLVGPGGVGKT